MPSYVPIVMYFLRMFIVVLQDFLHVGMIRVRGCYHTSRFVALLFWVSEIDKCIARGCLLLFYKNCIGYCGVLIH